MPNLFCTEDKSAEVHPDPHMYSPDLGGDEELRAHYGASIDRVKPYFEAGSKPFAAAAASTKRRCVGSRRGRNYYALLAGIPCTLTDRHIQTWSGFSQFPCTAVQAAQTFRYASERVQAGCINQLSCILNLLNAISRFQCMYSPDGLWRLWNLLPKPVVAICGACVPRAW